MPRWREVRVFVSSTFRDMGGVSHREMAGELGITEGSVVGSSTPLRKQLGVKTIRETLIVLAPERDLQLSDKPNSSSTDHGHST